MRYSKVFQTTSHRHSTYYQDAFPIANPKTQALSGQTQHFYTSKTSMRVIWNRATTKLRSLYPQNNFAQKGGNQKIYACSPWCFFGSLGEQMFSFCFSRLFYIRGVYMSESFTHSFLHTLSASYSGMLWNQKNYKNAKQNYYEWWIFMQLQKKLYIFLYIVTL